MVYHENCRGKRKLDQMRFMAEVVSDQQLWEMRHNYMWKKHEGKIASCAKCNISFTMNGIISNALHTHLGKSSRTFEFPETNNKRLDRIVYELQKNFAWVDGDEHSKALRYFASNSLTNVHLVSHASRCFQKGEECYANLPDAVSDSAQILYNEEADIWSDWLGRKEKRYMFRFQPYRPIHAVFMNTHNPAITTLLGCNNNVMLGMNGRSVLYVTGYNVKSQQKEERVGFEKVSGVLVNLLRNQVSKNIFDYRN